MLKGQKGGQNDKQMKTMKHSPWAIHCSASVMPVQLSRWVFRGQNPRYSNRCLDT